MKSELLHLEFYYQIVFTIFSCEKLTKANKHLRTYSTILHFLNPLSYTYSIHRNGIFLAEMV